jgi:hypothetical protein
MVATSYYATEESMSFPVADAFIEVGVTQNWILTFTNPGFVWPGNVLIVPHIGAIGRDMQLTYSQGPVGVALGLDSPGHVDGFYTFEVNVTNTGGAAIPYALEVSTS